MGSRNQLTRAVFLAAVAVLFAAAQPVLSHAANWTKLSPATSPPARTYPAMAFDPVSGKIVLFGGFGDAGNLNDTWTFDGTNWTQVNPSVAPPVRNGATMAFDRPTQKLVMFGGFDTNHYLQDTWIWDGATSTWTQAQLPKSPPNATGAMMFSDPVTGQAMMFGGYNLFKPLFPVFSNTWRWAGTAWQKLNPSTVPYPRAWGTTTLDTIRHQVVLTGGTGDTIRTDNTWAWNGTNWKQLSPAAQVSAFLGGGSAFAPAAQAAVLFGGTNETWSWNGTTWAQLTPTNSPSVTSGVGMAYDSATHQVILFGGETAGGTVMNETWQFGGN